MSRLSVPRASTAVAFVAVVVAVLAVMFPGLGFGDPGESSGGSPTNAFMNTVPGGCSQVDHEGVNPMPTAVAFDQGSHLLVYFTSQWRALDVSGTLLLGFELLHADGEFVTGTPLWSEEASLVTPASGTVMYTFEDVPPGLYTVQMFAQTRPARPLGHPHVILENCALTVIVVPGAE
jgi:hypothetical protein